MKTWTLFIVLFLMGFALSAPAFSDDLPKTWKTQKLEAFNSDSVMRQVQFVDQNTGYIAGEGGIMYKTIDGGENWTQLFTKTTANIEGVYFIDANTGWVAFSGGGSIVDGVERDFPATLRKTVDGGQTFADVNSSNGIKKIIMLDGNNGYAFSVVKDKDNPNNRPRKLAVTKDGGASWKIIREPSSVYNEEELSDFSAVDANTCYLVTTKGELLKTTDGGNAWVLTTLTIPTPTGDENVSLYAVKYVDANNGFVAGKKVVLKTNDGQSWANVTPKDYFGYSGVFYAIDVKNPNEAVITGNTEGIILHTTDGGSTWDRSQSIDNSGTFYAISYLGKGQGFAVGNYGNGILSRLMAVTEETPQVQSASKTKKEQSTSVKKVTKKKGK